MIGISKRQAKSALDELNELVTRQLKKEGLLRLAGLGVFRKRKLKACMGRNPSHGRADQDSGADPFTLHAGQGTERLSTWCSLAPLTGETFCALDQATVQDYTCVNELPNQRKKATTQAEESASSTIAA
jgi:Bacterial DNA-binding protein